MICLMVFCQLGGQVLKGEAWGDSEDRARNGALASLSQSIYVKVETTITATEGEENFRAFARTVKEVTTTSNLPLLGTTFTPVEKKGREFKVTVMLDPARALSLYEDRLSALQKDLDEAAQFLKDGGDAVLRYNRLIKANGELEEFDIYRFIYLALGGKKTYTVPLTQSQISSALHKLTATFDDLELALKHHITRIINYSMIYVHYPALYPSKEVTQFSRIVRDRLIAMLKVTENLEQAQYHLRSSYEITEEGMVLTLRLVSPEGKIEQAEFIRLSPPAYQAYRYMPSNFDVAQSIASGELISNKLLVQFSGLDGSDQLFFVKGDLAGFKIRANMPVEYYIIGHNYSAEGVYSYLLPLKSGFIGRINSDQVNRWIQLPEFEVIEPFGVETLQVIASTGDLSKSLPPVVRDHKNGLYKITGDPSTAVFRTRGLTPPQEEVETAEATLTMTLMEK
ncbi:MAG: hypothetical protein FJ042_06305 [Candidatus Cloacimonetes bacterium]|nr:hypothetical protein [Candidatus Cloacimonadota bacterium]